MAIDGFGNTDTLNGIEGVRGTALADTLIGNSQSNQFTGLNGNDTFTGGGGFDELRYDRDSTFGGNSAITATFTAAGVGTVVDGFGATDSFSGILAIRGTAFADSFIGFAGGAKEEFFGLAGNDTLNGGAYGNFDFARYDRDASYGGTGSINLNFATGFATDGFGNTDTLINIYGVWGGVAGDTLTGDARNNGFIGGGGNDTINGGGGFDTLFYFNENNNVAVNVNLSTGLAVDTFGATDVVSNIEDVQTGNLNDTIIGGNVSESFSGNGGADSIFGGGGFDFMRGFSGNDTLNGAPGVGIHADLSSGDADTAAYDDVGATQGVNVNLSAGTATDGFGNTDTLIDIERCAARVLLTRCWAPIAKTSARNGSRASAATTQSTARPGLMSCATIATPVTGVMPASPSTLLPARQLTDLVIRTRSLASRASSARLWPTN